MRHERPADARVHRVRAPAGVVLLQGEDSPSATVRPDLAALGADLDRVVVYDTARFTTDPLALPEDLDVVELAVLAVRARLVVIDPAPYFVTCNPNSERAVRDALAPLARLAQRMEWRW